MQIVLVFMCPSFEISTNQPNHPNTVYMNGSLFGVLTPLKKYI